MPFKKLHRDLQTKMIDLEVKSPTPFQIKSIPTIKSGANVYCLGSKGCGKTTTLILTTLHKLKFRAIGNVPRTIILVENKEKIEELHNTFKTFTKGSNLRIYQSHEEIHLDLQKSEIAMGVDILIATPQALKKLFLSNGLNTAALQIISVDDAEFLAEKSAYSAIMSITPSFPKCQYVLYMEKMEPKVKRFQSHFMKYPKLVKE